MCYPEGCALPEVGGRVRLLLPFLRSERQPWATGLIAPLDGNVESPEKPLPSFKTSPLLKVTCLAVRTAAFPPERAPGAGLTRTVAPFLRPLFTTQEVAPAPPSP